MVVFNIIFAVLSFVCAGLCIWNPFGSFIVFGYIISGFLAVWGLMAIIGFFVSRRNNARVTGFEAAMGLIGFIFGVIGILFFVFNITIPGFVFAVEEFCVIILLVFLGVEGLLCLISAIANARYHGAFITVLGVLLGLLMIAGAVLGIMNMEFVISILGIILGVAFGINGIRLLIYCIE